MAYSHSSSLTSGTVRLSQDIATLINNPKGSDIQFRVGGGNTTFQGNGKNIYNESATVTIYAHSIILRCRSRYFDAMLDDEKQWKESIKGVIYKPNISPTTFLEVISYLYTGNIHAKSENIIELITAAEEMGLEELSIRCQTELIRAVKLALSDKEEEEDNDHNTEDDKTLKKSIDPRLPVDVAVRTLIIPALDIANSHTLSYFLQQLLRVIPPRMATIIASPDSNAAFVSGISSHSLAQILTSDYLDMEERDIWDLALSWGCQQCKLLKTAIEASLKMRSNADDNGSGDNDNDNDDVKSSDVMVASDADDRKEYSKNSIDNDHLVSVAQLKQLKAKLSPLLPTIRFSLLTIKDYTHMVDILNYFLSHRRSLDLQRYFIDPSYTGQLDPPRTKYMELSNIVVESRTWELLRKHIFEAGGIAGCTSLDHLKLKLLFRASEHDFRAKTFHELCDKKGPTIFLVKSTDGYLFGGVNFAIWDCCHIFPISHLNFIFSLPDGRHRNNPLTFKRTDISTSVACNDPNHGPTLGNGHDIHIADSANTNRNSYSNLPCSFDGEGASNTVLAGARNFMVSDYEVFLIYL